MTHETKIIQSASQINYSYATVRLSQSRIEKGLLAIPTTLAKRFPDHNAEVQIHSNDSPTSESKRYSVYTGSTKESRIGGLRQWFAENELKSGDEIVVQVIDERRSVYRLIPEKNFVATTLQIQNGFDRSTDEREAFAELSRLSAWTNIETNAVALNEYWRLAGSCASLQRPLDVRKATRSRESAPAGLRMLLGRLYQGHCQVCDFWFRKRDNEPYFEVHHLDATKGHHPKNLVVVCGNCHNQFEHAEVTTEFDEEWWLIRVFFNGICHPVHRIDVTAGAPGFSKELHL